MAKTIKRVAKNPAGRPGINDHLALYLFVEVERRRRRTSLRQLVKDRKFRFGGWPGLPVTEPCETRDLLGGEALRRRFGEARVHLGLGGLPAWVKGCSAHAKVRSETKAALDRIVEGLM